MVGGDGKLKKWNKQARPNFKVVIWVESSNGCLFHRNWFKGLKKGMTLYNNTICINSLFYDYLFLNFRKLFFTKVYKNLKDRTEFLCFNSNREALRHHNMFMLIFQILCWEPRKTPRNSIVKSNAWILQKLSSLRERALVCTIILLISSPVYHVVHHGTCGSIRTGQHPVSSEKSV